MSTGIMGRSAHLLAACVVVACAGSAKPPATSARPMRCEVVSAPSAPPESIVVVTTMAMESGHVVQQPNVAERFVAAHAYETLVRADCAGATLPGIAVSWRADSSGTRWTFTLRDGARFWNGDPVTAGAVVDAWRETAAAPSAMLARRIATAATILNDRTLVISLPDSQPLLLSDPELTVLRRGGPSPWPEGTGPYRVVVPQGIAGKEPVDGVLQLTPVAPDSRQFLTIRSGPGTLARDRIDAGLDLLITDDPGIASYALTRPDYVAVPLGPDRTFVMLSPATPDDPRATGVVVERATAFREALARDAVRASATPAAPSAWWRARGGCDAAPHPDPALAVVTLRPRVVFARDDPIAGALAARLAALASMSGADSSFREVAPELFAPGSRITSAGVTAEEFSRALRTGNDRAYVVALPHEARWPCGSIARVVASAPWLHVDARASDLARAVIPLIDVAPLVVVRRGRMGLTVEGNSLRVSTAPPAGLPQRP
jgi:extracellular solute-binding protein (family 5)